MENSAFCCAARRKKPSPSWPWATSNRSQKAAFGSSRRSPGDSTRVS